MPSPTTRLAPSAHLSRRHLLLGAAAVGTLPSAWAQPKAPAWGEVEKAARGQTVYWNAWAGSERINAYLQWVAVEVKSAYGVTLEHVKITDAAEVVKRVRAEKTAKTRKVRLTWCGSTAKTSPP